MAGRDLEAGEELTLDYGGRPLRDLLRGYGFTPDQAAASDPCEVCEDWGGAACEALLVQGTGQVGQPISCHVHGKAMPDTFNKNLKQKLSG